VVVKRDAGDHGRANRGHRPLRNRALFADVSMIPVRGARAASRRRNEQREQKPTKVASFKRLCQQPDPHDDHEDSTVSWLGAVATTA